MRPIERTGKNILTRNCFQFVKRRYKGATVGLTKLEKSEINEPLNNVLTKNDFLSVVPERNSVLQLFDKNPRNSLNCTQLVRI